MKKLVLSLFILSVMLLPQQVKAVENITSLDDVEQPINTISETIETQPIHAEVTFDWLDISQAQRDTNIDYYKKLLFDENSSNIYFSKEQFQTQFAKYFKEAF